MRIEDTLESLCTPWFVAATGLTDASAVVRRAQDEAHGDYQLNGALALAKRAGKNPRQIATEVLALLEQARAESSAGFPLAKAEIAGPGFLNLTLDTGWLATQLAADRVAEDGGIGTVKEPQKIVIDFSGPNVAKQMHIGHIRSTILGDVLARLLSAIGHEVIRDNHIGDWGTQFGLLITAARELGGDLAAEGAQGAALPELEKLYVKASQLAKEDPAFAERARHELAKLQAGDADNLRVWQRFVDITRTALEQIYRDLDIRFDTWLGESAYNEALPGVIERLQARGLVREDQGALCLFFNEHEDAPADLRKVKEPLIVRKKDGAYLYATTDLATGIHRKETLECDLALYVVDARQALHFRQIFGALAMIDVDLACEHISFGSILGPGGKPLKTRDGDNVSLRSVLDEAEVNAQIRIGEEGLAIDEADRAKVAKIIGYGAVKYADLRQNRASDYVFDWEKMLSFKGNAGPTLQYAYARIASIFRKADLDLQQVAATSAPLLLEAKEERALGLALARFGDAVHEAARTRAPNVLCDQLYAIARAFSSFYEACPILKVDGALRESRLLLAAQTALCLRRGLALLGIETVDRM